VFFLLDPRLREDDGSNGKSGLNRDFPLEKKAVIPAKAGIQFIEKRLRSRSTLVLCPLRGLIFLLDSRLRGNDGSDGLFGFK
jgi:hypothetical protein